ncbi:MAG: hypothetical protein COA32_10365 [Fluviicola sp.]|nr:MAG: hypothetical protein COA32_10365 [Fluviicola sp.]
MKKRLADIVEIKSGKSFREKPEFINSDGCGLIQMRDVSRDGISSDLQYIERNEVNENQLLYFGDLIFVAKGRTNYAVVYEYEEPAVAASFFFVIRPDKELVQPWYLAWYINSSEAQAYFDRNRAGSSVGNIKKSQLERLEIALPDLSTQSKIGELSVLLVREKELVAKYMAKKERFIDGSIKCKIL